MKTLIKLKDQNIISGKVLNDIKSDHINDINFEGRNNNLHGRSKIISIVSNKGGVGKTSVAVVFAMFLSQKMEKRTLLLELDSSPGDFAVIFDIEKDKSLELALKFPEKYNEFVKNVCGNVDALKGVSNPLIAENIKEGAINRLINYILEDYDFIVVDTQTVINGPVLDVLRLSDEIFAVSEYSLESIARISSLVDVLAKKFSIPESKIKLIVNKKRFLSFFKICDISKVVKTPIYAFIKFDNRFNKSRFIFNKVNILNTRFFEEISRMLLKTSIGFSSNVKR